MLHGSLSISRGLWSKRVRAAEGDDQAAKIAITSPNLLRNPAQILRLLLLQLHVRVEQP